MTPEHAIPAASLIVFRRAAHGGPAEILMVQRAKAMRFAGGAAVFPGGRVDPADEQLARTLPAAELSTADMAAADLAAADLAGRIAAIRETLEETGLAVGLAPSPGAPLTAASARAARQTLAAAQGDMARMLAQTGWQLALGALTPFAHWCPPWKGGFDTRFYLADLGTGAVDIAVDATENTRAFWITPAEALAQADRGAIEIIFPTRRNLERLAQFASFAQARADAERHPPQRIIPQLAVVEGEQWLTIPAGLGYPVLGEPAASAQRGDPPARR